MTAAFCGLPAHSSARFGALDRPRVDQPLWPGRAGGFLARLECPKRPLERRHARDLLLLPDSRVVMSGLIAWIAPVTTDAIRLAELRIVRLQSRLRRRQGVRSAAWAADERGLVIIIHRPAGYLAGRAVDHGGEIKPAFPGRI